MKTIQPRHSECLREEPAEPSERLREEPAEPSQWDVLRYLEQSAILLDHILARGKQGGSGLPVDEQRALAQDLSVVSSVLSFLGKKVIPSLLADGPAGGPLRQLAAWQVLTRLGRLTAELELCFRTPPANLN